MDTFFLLPCTDTAPSGLAGCGVSWGSRALHRPPLQFGVVTSSVVHPPGCGESWDGGVHH